MRLSQLGGSPPCGPSLHLSDKASAQAWRSRSCRAAPRRDKGGLILRSCKSVRLPRRCRPSVHTLSTADAAVLSGEKDADGEEEEGNDEEKEDLIKGLSDAFSGIKDLTNVQTPASVWLPSKSSRYTKSKQGDRSGRIGPFVIDLSRGMWLMLSKLVRLPSFLWSTGVFKMQQLMLGNTFTKLMTVFMVGVPLCALGGVIYSWASKKNLLQGFIMAYGALYKIPGVTVIGEVNALTTHVMNVLWIIGTFTFAVMLGFVTEDITSYIMAIKSGNFRVIAANHTLVLNWTSQTLPLLRQIALTQAEARSAQRETGYEGPVVILADHDKEEMDRELREGLAGLKLDWHSRSGAPWSMADLERVAAGVASTVIMLQPDNTEDAAKKLIAAVVGVQATRAATQPRPFLRLKPQHLAVQVPDGAGEAELFEVVTRIMAGSSQTLRLTKLKGRRDLSMLLAQSAFCPGLASVYCSIVQEGRNRPEFYIRSYIGQQSFEGRTYRTARHCFKRAIVCGLVGPKGALTINPGDDLILAKEDSLIVLSENPDFEPEVPHQGSDLPPGAMSASSDAADADMGLPSTKENSSPLGLPLLKRTSVAEASHRAGTRDKTRAKHIVVTWWGGDIADLTKSLAANAPHGSVITVLCREKPEGFPKLELFPAITFKHLAADPASLAGLEKAKIGDVEAIVIGGTTNRPAKEADAVTITVMLLIQEVLLRSSAERKFPVHIVGMMHSSETGEVVNFLMDQLGKGVATAELLQPDELMAGVMAQAAQQPNMANLLAGFLYATKGQEIYLHNPQRYLLSEDTPITFREVMELAREQGDTALGYIAKDGGMHLAPSQTSSQAYSPLDKIVVIEGRKR